MSEPMLGEIKMFGGSFAPRGWAICKGQIITISSNQALFALLGTFYGGDGRTSFGLPDLRGRMPVGVGTGPGLFPIKEGLYGGAQRCQLGLDELPTHTHTASVTNPSLTATSIPSLTATSTPSLTATNTPSLTATSTPSLTATSTSNLTATLYGVSTIGNKTDMKDNVLGEASIYSDNRSVNMPLDSSSIKMAGTIDTTIGGTVDTVIGGTIDTTIGGTVDTVIGGTIDTTIEGIADIKVTVGSTGSGRTFSIMPPFLGVNFIISLEGTFPARN
jgi:microcystin-dependent protein